MRTVCGAAYDDASIAIEVCAYKRCQDLALPVEGARHTPVVQVAIVRVRASEDRGDRGEDAVSCSQRVPCADPGSPEVVPNQAVVYAIQRGIHHLVIEVQNEVAR